VVVPAHEPLLEPHLRHDLRTITFGDGGEVRLDRADDGHVEIGLLGLQLSLEVSFTQAHLRRNLLAAVAAAHAIGVIPEGRVELELSPGRGQRHTLPDGVTLIDDCYNANPMSMRAALEDLAATASRLPNSRRVAVLGDMLELGPREREFHAEIGEQAMRAGVDLLVTVGPLAERMADRFDGEVHAAADAAEASAMVPRLLGGGDVVLIKASRAVGLDVVCRALTSAGAPC
jgi:UDP-N-acetylmuramoyl-tripeptide--D-alanyl-D-alanine ligase